MAIKRYNIYVIELDKEVLTKKRFMKANPDYVDGKRCFYVGMTSHAPEKRFEQHKAGIKSNSYARRFGLKLRPRHYAVHNPMTYDDAVEMEKEKARRLRKRGYAVWQN